MRVLNSVSNATSDVIVSWKKPHGGDDINQYYIKWHQQGSNYRSGYKLIKHIVGKVNYTSTITNLQSGFEYEISVCAKSSAKDGIYQSKYITTGKFLYAHFTDHRFVRHIFSDDKSLLSAKRSNFIRMSHNYDVNADICRFNVYQSDLKEIFLKEVLPD